jgi:hypothetical protein
MRGPEKAGVAAGGLEFDGAISPKPGGGFVE